MLAALLIAYSVSTSGVDDDVDRALRRAGNEYAYGNHDEAILQLRALLAQGRLVTEAHVMEAREYLALCYYLTGRIEQMETEFTKLLYLDPDYTPDEYVVAPSVIEAFEGVRARLEPNLAKIREARQGPGVESPPKVIIRSTERPIEHRSAFATFLPFGIGQFNNGDTEMGVVFALTETLLLAANIGAYFMARYNADSPDEVQRYMVIQYGSAALFGMAWSIGAFQAKLNFVPTVMHPDVVTEEILPASGGLLRLQLDF